MPGQSIDERLAARRVQKAWGTVLSVFVVIVALFSGLPPSVAGWEAFAAGTRDPDATALVARAGQAVQRVRPTAPDAILRQVVVDPHDDRMVFLFVSPAAAQEIDVFVPPGASSPGSWEVRRPPYSKLTHHAHPGIDVGALRTGPAAAVRAITGHWPGCTRRHIYLVGRTDTLTWQAFCTLPDGRVASGTVDGRTGGFAPSAAPPAYPPPTAIPAH